MNNQKGFRFFRKTGEKKEDRCNLTEENKNTFKPKYDFMGKKLPDANEHLSVLQTNNETKIKKFVATLSLASLYIWNCHMGEAIQVIHFAAAVGSLVGLKSVFNVAGTQQISNWKTSMGMQPLHFATHFGNNDVIQLLAAKGCDLDSPVRDTGMTALHLACKMNNIGAVQILLSLHAKLDIRDKQGNTPLDIAIQSGHRNIISCIEERNKRQQSEHEIQTLSKCMSQHEDRLTGVEARLEKLEQLNMRPEQIIPNPVTHQRQFKPNPNPILCRSKPFAMVRSQFERNDISQRRFSGYSTDSAFGGSTDQINISQEGREKEKLQQSYERIYHDMKPQDVIVKLFTKCVLTPSQKEHINAMSQTCEKNEYIFDVIHRSAYQYFEVFIEALNESGQHDIASEILHN